MKRLIAILLSLITVFAIFTGCEKPASQDGDSSSPTATAKATAKATPQPTPVVPDVTEKTDYVTDTWVAVEIEFKADVEVKDFNDAVLDVTFTNRETGTQLVMPGFWDGGDSWKVRFAPTEHGIWEYVTKTSGATELGINGKTGTVAANSYKGDLAIYKHGFVKTQENLRYFIYADGTPFFYLGDTHWNMPTEEYDSAGKNAGNIQTDSHFKYIVDRRAAQGFTVYQSEPIGASYDVDDGKISKADIRGFQRMDLYFQYIAQKGLVHANAELIFPSSATKKGFSSNVEALTRYWVARYGAYPVMWTLGQEVDDAKNQADGTLQVYLRMCAQIYKCDPYHSPISAHQLNGSSITVNGGAPIRPIDGGYNEYDPTQNKISGVTRASKFKDVLGHSWWANQWRPVVDQQYNFFIPIDYWENGGNKPIVNYEARYHFLYGGDFCMRAQAWIAYLTGHAGHAYGGADMWLYQGRYATDSDGFDGVETITVEKKITTHWSDLIDANISNELIYLRGFMEHAGWYELTPDFDYGKAFKKSASKEGYYACAHNGDEVYVVYLYNRTKDSAGSLVNMDANATYTAQWFDTRTGTYTLISDSIKTNGEYDIPQKPVADDMVLLVTKN
jgi:hypothetical protein